MIVRLSKEYPTGKILKAFSDATGFDPKWRSCEITGQAIQTQEGLLKTIGVKVFSTLQEKEYGFFGKMVEREGGLSFTLQPLLPGDYDEIEVIPRFLCGANMGVTEMYFAEDVVDPDFEPALKFWNAFINAFYANLREICL